jgi:hypothetical protein
MKLTINAANVKSQIVGSDNEVMLDYQVSDYALTIDAAAIITGGGALMAIFQQIRTDLELVMTRQEMDRRGLRAEADAAEAKIADEQQERENAARAKSKEAMKRCTEEMLAALKPAA